jgi:hypothetical protein
MRIDISKVGVERDRLALLDAAQQRGIVLLHFPGHIMLYLGRDEGGRPMVMHAFAEYLESCSAEDAKASGRTETLFTVDRVQVSDLSLGKGTSRKSFLERITHITLIGGDPGPALLGVVERRPAAPIGALPEKCDDSEDVTILVSPRTPHPGVPLRVVVSSERDLGAVSLVLEGPDKQRHAPKLRTLGGPPFGYWGEIAKPSEGKWTAAIGEGERIAACKRFSVNARGEKRQGPGGHVWQPQRRWSRATENLYSTFIEQLFDYPFDDRTWTNLQQLLGDRERNILFEYLGQGEEERLSLEPDCADLSYFLRAYFSWKLRLPFAYRHCSRGSNGKAPYCDGDLHDNLARPEGKDEVEAFANFVRRSVGDGVHSGTGRTGPEQDDTDYYPIPLTRDAIRPGAAYADPYGHSYVIADWVAQGADKNGMLVGADAQPDGTIGRRRFWRGAFLFTPETREAGAGFKAFRPLIYRGDSIHALDNGEITKGNRPFSLEQYQGSKDDFYDRVEALINPRPLDPTQALNVLLDALHEQLKSRVLSVQNGEDYKKKNNGVIDMPEDHAIFETAGAWEDYSTPSRDMRALIAMDTVMGFPDIVKRRPERFGIAKAALDGAVKDVKTHLDKQLDKRRFSYVRSDGSNIELSLKQAIARAKELEMAYNPNDCVEIRWGAAEGSDERATCRRHAPTDQLNRMKRYRSWFAERKRPPR